MDGHPTCPTNERLLDTAFASLKCVLQLIVIDELTKVGIAVAGRPTMLMVAGFGDDSSMFAALRNTEMATSCRLVPINLPGFGAPALSKRTTLCALASCLDARVRAEGARVVVAHSVASIIASLSALRHGSPIETIVSATLALRTRTSRELLLRMTTRCRSGPLSSNAYRVLSRNRTLSNAIAAKCRVPIPKASGNSDATPIPSRKQTFRGSPE